MTLEVCRRAMGGVLLLVAGLAIAWMLRGLATSLPPVRLQVEERFNHGVVSDGARVSVRGFIATPRGFALGPRSEGEIEYSVRTRKPLTRWSAITLQWYGGEPGIRSAVDLIGPNGPEPLLQDRNLVGTRLSLPASMAGRTDIALRFSASNPTD